MNQQKMGIFIAALRKQQGLTQEQLGEILGVTNKTVSRWETGRYMPDIDMLQELSAALHITINELLAGERIGDASGFRELADDNLVCIPSRDSAFALQDRIHYFKRKWLRDHRGLLALWIIAWIGLCIGAYVWGKAVLAALTPVAGLLIYGHLRNQMMIYVEDRAYTAGGQERK